MKRSFKFIVVLVALCLLPSIQRASPPAPRVRKVDNPTGLQIVTLRTDADLDGIIKEHGLNPRHKYRHALNGFAARMNDATIDKLKHDPRVRAVEPDGRVVPCAQTTGAGIIRMGVPNFPVAHISGQDHRINVDVAVLDTGIQTNHPDLNVVQSVDFTGFGFDDHDGHGTHVAGIIGALDNNIGVVGVAPGARLWNVKVVDIANGEGAWSGVLAGLDYVVQHAGIISVVNCSFEGQPVSIAPYVAIHQAFLNVANLGIVIVAAAGNESNDISFDGVYGNNDDVLPAALNEAMAVSGMDEETDHIANFSNVSTVRKPYPTNCPPGVNPCGVTSPGAGIDVAAPSVDILSTWTNSTYATRNGTSMAAAHVSGLVALYIAANGRGYTLSDTYRIRQTIINNSQPQTAWACNNPFNGSCTYDEGNPEPLAYPSENWVPKLIITGATNAPGGFQVGFATVPGYTYTVQYCTNLSASNQWTSLATTNGEGSLTSVTVTDPTPDIARYYRLVRTPTSVPHLPPEIFVQPTNKTVFVGSNVTFTVLAAGSPPMSYQWLFNGTNLLGPNTALSLTNVSLVNVTLTLTNANLTNWGTYAVVLSNAYGAVTSAVAILTLYDPQLLVYEGFGYDAGSVLSGQYGGIGWASWASAWTATIGDAIVANSLGYTDTQGNKLLTVGNSFYYSASNLVSGSASTFRYLDPPRGDSNTTTWVSFVGVRVGPTTNVTANIYPRAAAVSLFMDSTEHLAIGNSSGAPSNTWAIIPGGSFANIQSSTNTFSQQSLAVVRIDHKGGKDDAYLFINPTLGVEPNISSAVAKSLGTFDFSFNRIRPFVGANDAANSRPYAELRVDEIRVGSTYLSVTPFSP